MKKISLVLVVIILAVIALLPIVGNKFMQKYTEESLTRISAQGVKLESMHTNSTYLNTKKHFEFIIEDSSALVKYINAHTSNQLPLTTQQSLNGTRIGVDLKYSNLPFAKSINVDIYPMRLSKTMQDELKTEDVNFYNKFTAFLKNRGLLYHLEYNLINSRFKSYVKDIDQKYHLQNGSQVNIKLIGIRFKGEGELNAPKSLSTTIKSIYFDANQTGVKALLSLQNFRATNKFVSFSDYDTTASFKEMQFLIKGTNDDVNISVHNLKTSSNAVPKGERVNMNSKSTLGEMHLRSVPLSLDVEELKSDVHVQGVEKEALEKMSEMVSKTEDINAISYQPEFQRIVMQLLSKGFSIKIPNISLGRLVVDKTENFGGVKIDLNLNIKEDENLSVKMKKSPLLFLSNIFLETNIELSQKMYDKIVQTSPMAQTISSYVQKKKDNVVFKIEFKDSQLSVNGKRVQ